MLTESKRRVNEKYRRDHDLIQMNTLIPRVLKEEVDRVCKARGWSRPQFIRQAVAYFGDEAQAPY